MRTPGDPVFEATVSPLLIRLLGGSPRLAPAEMNGADAAPLPASAASAIAPACGAPDDAGFRDPPLTQLRLRRDGARPLGGRGALIWEDWSRISLSEQDDRGVGRMLRLFLCEDDGVIAQISYHPDDGLPARPIWRAEHVGSADAFRDFLVRSGGGACFLAADTTFPPAEILGRRLDPIGGVMPTAPLLLPDPAKFEGHLT